MKKIILLVITSLLFLISCSESKDSYDTDCKTGSVCKTSSNSETSSVSEISGTVPSNPNLEMFDPAKTVCDLHNSGLGAVTFECCAGEVGCVFINCWPIGGVCCVDAGSSSGNLTGTCAGT